MSVEELLERDFATIADLIREHARERPHAPALVDDPRQLDYAALDALMDRVGAALVRDGVRPGDKIAICAASSIEYAAAFLGALRVGVAVAPLAPSSTAESLLAMLDDCGAKLLFLDRSVATALAPVRSRSSARWIALDGGEGELATWQRWLAPEGPRPEPVAIDPNAAFNLIYS